MLGLVLEALDHTKSDEEYHPQLFTSVKSPEDWVYTPLFYFYLVNFLQITQQY